MPYLTPENFNAIRKVLLDLQPSSPDVDIAVDLLDEAERCVASPGLRQKAHDRYATDDLEIDDEGVGTSLSDGGIWVQAWVFVPDDEETGDA